jgi:hypothetical protein
VEGRRQHAVVPNTVCIQGVSGRPESQQLPPLKRAAAQTETYHDRRRQITRVRAMSAYAAACCLRLACLRDCSPAMDSLSFSSTRPQARNSSTTKGFSFRRVPPPNILINARCACRVNSSQMVVSSIIDPRWFSRPQLRAAKVKARLRGVMMAVQATRADIPNIPGARAQPIERATPVSVADAKLKCEPKNSPHPGCWGAGNGMGRSLRYAK